MVRKKHAYVAELSARLIRDIRHGRATSRLELAQRQKLAPSTVGIYVDRLVQEGYLTEKAAKSRQPGRRAQTLTLRGEAGSFIGVEFEARTLHAVGVDFAGGVLRRQRTEIPAGATAPDVLEALRGAITAMRGATRQKLLGIGVGVPGLVEPGTGVARHYRFIEGWRDIAVVDHLREHFQAPIVMENNVRATTMGIMLFEKPSVPDDFICVLIRSGVGAGIIRQGQLHCGANYTAGEIGRVPLLDSSATLEDITSLQAILRFARENAAQFPESLLRGDDFTISDLIHAAREGDTLARQSLSSAIHNLGWLAHLLALVENPPAIVFAGPLNELGEWLRLEIQAALGRFATLSKTERPAILLTQLGESAGALGAASLAIEAWKPVATKR